LHLTAARPEVKAGKGRAAFAPTKVKGEACHRRSDSGRAASTVARPKHGHGDPGTPGASRSSSAAMRLAAGSELDDEFLCLVQLAAEPVPPLGRSLRERLARVACVQLAERDHALPLPARSSAMAAGHSGVPFLLSHLNLGLTSPTSVDRYPTGGSPISGPAFAEARAQRGGNRTGGFGLFHISNTRTARLQERIAEMAERNL
jgi:hypothetical protein